MRSEDLLVEICTEELPPNSLLKLSKALGDELEAGLKKAGLSFNARNDFATPRRLAVMIKALDVAQQDQDVERKGPAVKAAFDSEGEPTKAALGFARSCGVEMNELGRMETDKGSWLVFQKREKGKVTTDLLEEILATALTRLPIPKKMRWGDGVVEFVRPVHCVLVLWGNEGLPLKLLGLTSGRETLGHRFYCQQALRIESPDSYEAVLEKEGRVIASFDRRRKMIRQQIISIEQSLNGGVVVIDPSLLDEVTGLVEWPQAVLGTFDEGFLRVPKEALISSMKKHQKYFHVVDQAGELLPYFVTISNIQAADPETIRAGNERVLRSRLSDAAFFWDQDCKERLESYREKLSDVVFQKKLGSTAERSERVSALAVVVAKQLDVDEKQVARAAELAKCDLLTGMVGEFPDLQGVMGCYYAKNDGEASEVALALNEQYMPRFSGDELPVSEVGQVLSIADKVDTLVGIFGIGQIPTGDKDPFGLRRAALGVLRIMIEKQLPVALYPLLLESGNTFGGLFDSQPVASQLHDYMMDRLKGYYLDQGMVHDVFDAVLARHPAEPYDFDLRVNAVNQFSKIAEAESLSQANKRIYNILSKTEESVDAIFDVDLLVVPEEKSLAEQIETLTEKVRPLLAERSYAKALVLLAQLQTSVDEFFDKVMVMDENEDLRKNRLSLLKSIRNLFMRVADLSKLQR